eukprot:3277431-Prymnesium_polylepis.1
MGVQAGGEVWHLPQEGQAAGAGPRQCGQEHAAHRAHEGRGRADGADAPASDRRDQGGAHEAAGGGHGRPRDRATHVAAVQPRDRRRRLHCRLVRPRPLPRGGARAAQVARGVGAAGGHAGAHPGEQGRPAAFRDTGGALLGPRARRALQEGRPAARTLHVLCL